LEFVQLAPLVVHFYHQADRWQVVAFDVPHILVGFFDKLAKDI